MTGNEVNRNAMFPFYNLLFIGYIEIIMQLEKKNIRQQRSYCDWIVTITALIISATLKGIHA